MASVSVPLKTLHEQFRAQAAANPGAPALIHAGKVTTYLMLDIASDAYAAQLTDAGLAPGDLVPLLAPRSAEVIAAILGILKCGAAYVMLDSRWPEKRLRAVLDQLSPPFVVADNPPQWCAASISLPSASLFDLSCTRTSDTSLAAAGDPCTIFFTSGTTGNPKGVIAPHRGIVELFANCDFANFGTGVVMTQAAPLMWGGFALELWSVLLNGGASVLVDQPYLFPGTLRSLVQKHGVNSVFLTPSLFNLFVDEDIDAFQGVRQVLSGGERMSPVHAGKFLAKYPEVRLMHTFGSVECPLLSTAHHVRSSDCAGSTVPIGRALRSRKVYLLDGERQCGPGEVGEICVAGDGIGLGYLNDPVLTAEKFRTMRVDGERRRVFRSGDSAHYRDDGVLIFDGRSDGMVKFRGHRIELAEIERAALSAAGVTRCVALYRAGQEDAREAVLLFFTANGEPLIDEQDLRRKLALELPAYTIPQRIHRIADIPLTQNGKLDSAALLAIDDSRQQGS